MEMICRAVAKRAGGRITINGFKSHDPGAEARKVPNVDTITFENREGILIAIATDKNGVQYRLV